MSAAAEDAWKNYSEAQRREVKTACVLVALSPMVKASIPGIVSRMKAILSSEIKKLETKKEQSKDDKKLLEFLHEVENVPESLSGIQRLEEMKSRAMNLSNGTALSIAKKCFDSLPDAMKFSGFASLIKHDAVSKFISFAISWRYTGKSYEAPQGMSSPFSGYDDIINSLMGHPLCKAKMAEESRKWEEWYAEQQEKIAAENKRRKEWNDAQERRKAKEEQKKRELYLEQQRKKAA